MAEMSTRRRNVNAPPNIYTVLVFTAVLVLGGAVGYILYRSNQLFGSQNPFQVPASAGLVSSE